MEVSNVDTVDTTVTDDTNTNLMIEELERVGFIGLHVDPKRIIRVELSLDQPEAFFISYDINREQDVAQIEKDINDLYTSLAKYRLIREPWFRMGYMMTQKWEISVLKKTIYAPITYLDAAIRRVVYAFKQPIGTICDIRPDVCTGGVIISYVNRHDLTQRDAISRDLELLKNIIDQFGYEKESSRWKVDYPICECHWSIRVAMGSNPLTLPGGIPHWVQVIQNLITWVDTYKAGISPYFRNSVMVHSCQTGIVVSHCTYFKEEEESSTTLEIRSHLVMNLRLSGLILTTVQSKRGASTVFDIWILGAQPDPVLDSVVCNGKLNGFCAQHKEYTFNGGGDLRVFWTECVDRGLVELFLVYNPLLEVTKSMESMVMSSEQHENRAPPDLKEKSRLQLIKDLLAYGFQLGSLNNKENKDTLQLCWI